MTKRGGRKKKKATAVGFGKKNIVNAAREHDVKHKERKNDKPLNRRNREENRKRTTLKKFARHAPEKKERPQKSSAQRGGRERRDMGKEEDWECRHLAQGEGEDFTFWGKRQSEKGGEKTKLKGNKKEKRGQFAIVLIRKKKSLTRGPGKPGFAKKGTTART